MSSYSVPHFEKMLYDQGQIVNVYLDTFLITGDEYYSTVARDILDHLRRDMIGKEGEIFSAEDADSAEYEDAPRKKEGAFYVWTSKEVHHYIYVNLLSTPSVLKKQFILGFQNCRKKHVILPYLESACACKNQLLPNMGNK